MCPLVQEGFSLRQSNAIGLALNTFDNFAFSPWLNMVLFGIEA